MIHAVFRNGYDTANAYGLLYQWDYHQILRIEGLNLPTAVEVHFSLQEKGGGSITRIGTTKGGATDVYIPDDMLENNGISQNYTVYAFVYITGIDSGKTVKKIIIPVTARPRPEVPGGQEDVELFREAITAVNESAARAETAEASAEAWAHGHESYPERDEDNARFYAERARDTAAEIPGQVADAKDEIDKYVSAKEQELKGDTGNVHFAAFKVVNGRLLMYSDPDVDRVRFVRKGSRLTYRLAF